MQAKAQESATTENEVRETLHKFDELWDELFPAEQARIVQLLVERVDLTFEGASITLRTDGPDTLVAELRSSKTLQVAA